MKPYTFRTDTAIADTAFYAYGKNPEELIKNACMAVTDAMVDVKKIKAEKEKTFSKQADNLESLLYAVMEEIIYLKDAEQMVYGDFKVEKIDMKAKTLNVTVTIRGEKIDRKRHDAHSDVKAVTYHDYYVKKTKDGYKASVTLDV